ncbi:hypothetical protein L1987_12405 [Smallanthus sonchifolius]|uniref:Uncharacterized protein n=1 Tax=Smallanthus sonchifolius TaxID=185202 RepID=A0ACB9JF85_9ASTR|nr:hypothetical protein L1987_12405 [Smallanthus sonchifolius]
MRIGVDLAGLILLADVLKGWTFFVLSITFMCYIVYSFSSSRAASNIWSVGYTVIELLTCVPPYYDLQPMPALFRIVQDETPPIPDSLSPGVTAFLRQCFKKDPKLRPDAKTLLSHPSIQNSRRVVLPRHSGTLR